jgi:hypothetical protein
MTRPATEIARLLSARLLTRPLSTTETARLLSAEGLNVQPWHLRYAVLIGKLAEPQRDSRFAFLWDAAAIAGAREVLAGRNKRMKVTA